MGAHKKAKHKVDNAKKVIVNREIPDYKIPIDFKFLSMYSELPSGVILSTGIFLDTNDKKQIEKVRESITSLMVMIGFNGVNIVESKFGSWFGRIRYRSKYFLTKPEVKKKLDEIEFGLKTHLIEKQQSEIDKTLSEAVSNVLNSIKEIPNAAIKLSNILIIKTTIEDVPQIVIIKLTIEEMILIEKNPNLLKNPEFILDEINSMLRKDKIS